MTETPMERAFDAQSTMLRRSTRAFERGLATQREAIEAFRDVLDAQEETQRRNVEATQRAVDAYFEALPGAGAAAGQEAVDEGFTTLLEFHAQSWDAVDRLAAENAAAYDELVEQYTSMADARPREDAADRTRARTEVVVEPVEDASER